MKNEIKIYRHRFFMHCIFLHTWYICWSWYMIHMLYHHITSLYWWGYGEHHSLYGPRSLAIQAEITVAQAEITAARAKITGRVHRNRPRSLRPRSRKAEITVKHVNKLETHNPFIVCCPRLHNVNGYSLTVLRNVMIQVAYACHTITLSIWVTKCLWPFSEWHIRCSFCKHYSTSTSSTHWHTPSVDVSDTCSLTIRWCLCVRRQLQTVR